MPNPPKVTQGEVQWSLRGHLYLHFKCPHCDQYLKSQETDVGTVDDCPKCHGQFVVSKSLLSLFSAAREREHIRQAQRQRKQADRSMKSDRSSEAESFPAAVTLFRPSSILNALASFWRREKDRFWLLRTLVFAVYVIRGLWTIFAILAGVAATVFRMQLVTEAPGVWDWGEALLFGIVAYVLLELLYIAPLLFAQFIDLLLAMEEHQRRLRELQEQDTKD